jgi:hypothetical protein
MRRECIKHLPKPLTIYGIKREEQRQKCSVQEQGAEEDIWA